ncbi:MAG: OmpP1/FadL family transporter [Polyangiales bacterium]
MNSPRLRVAAALALLAMATSTSVSEAAGLYFSDRGVRPVGRAGAFVAGADDLGAIWYNPAGIAFAGQTFLLDASWLRFNSSYQRRSYVYDPNTKSNVLNAENYYPEVKGTSPLLPLPTIVLSGTLGADPEKWNFAAGVYAPYSALTSYPEQPVPFNGRTVAPPQRYSLVTLDGSALVIIGGYLSYKPSKNIALGFGVQMLTGTFHSRLAFSACPHDSLICAQEAPDYDVYSQLKVGPIFAPSATGGIIAILSDTPTSEVRLGLSGQLPYWINAPATVQIRPPAAAPFQQMEVEGDSARVKFKLPAIARVGLETRLGEKKQTRLELALFYEAWSMHDRITIAPEGDGIRLHKVAGFPDPYPVGELNQARGFRDTFSIHGGVEHHFDAGGYPMAVRGGASYERSAVPQDYLSVLTVDLDKVQVALGSSVWVGEKKNLRLDAVFAYTFGFQTDVDPGAAQIAKVKVLRANDPPDDQVTKVNGGTYKASAQIIGVGLSWKY